MSDKFDKLSIYDVDYKLVDNDGEEQVFTFKPLPFAFYPRIYSLLGKLSSLEGKDTKDFMDSLDAETTKELLELELQMVINSYPEISKDKAEKFVLSNMFNLIEPLIMVTFKQEKANPRKTQALAKQ